MPTMAFHRNYWTNSDTSATPVRVTQGGYPMWQSAVLFTCGFGFQGFTIWWGMLTEWLSWTWAMIGVWWQTSRAQRRDVRRTMATLAVLETRWRPLVHRSLGAMARFDDEQRTAFLCAVDALDHAAYPAARQAVRRTAVILEFNRPEAWVTLSRQIRMSQPAAENMFRHMQACHFVRETPIPSTLSNPELNLMTELAYQGMAGRVR